MEEDVLAKVFAAGAKAAAGEAVKRNANAVNFIISL